MTCFRFRDSFGHFLVTFSDASVTFFVTFFAKLLLPDSFCDRVTGFLWDQKKKQVGYHSNRNVYQTNSPEFEVGNGKNYQCPKKSFDF